MRETWFDALREVAARCRAEDVIGDQEAEDRVAEELKPLVALPAFVAGGGVTERAVEEAQVAELMPEPFGELGELPATGVCERVVPGGHVMGR